MAKFSMDDFKKVVEKVRPAGRTAEQVSKEDNISGISMESLIDIRDTLEGVGDSVKKTNEKLKDSPEVVTQLIDLNTDFGDYFSVLQELDTVLGQLADPDYEMNEDAADRLQSLMYKEDLLLDAINDQAQQDSSFQEKFLNIQRQSGIYFRKKSFEDKEMSDLAMRQNMKMGELWSEISENIKPLSTTMGKDLVDGLGGVLLGPFYGMGKALKEFGSEAAGGLMDNKEKMGELKDKFMSFFKKKATEEELLSLQEADEAQEHFTNLKNELNQVVEGGEYNQDIFKSSLDELISISKEPHYKDSIDEIKSAVNKLTGKKDVPVKDIESLTKNIDDSLDNMSSYLKNISKSKGGTLAEVFQKEPAKEIKETKTLSSELELQTKIIQKQPNFISEIKEDIVSEFKEINKERVEATVQIEERILDSSDLYEEGSDRLTDMLALMTDQAELQQEDREREEDYQDDQIESQKDIAKAISKSGAAGEEGGGIFDTAMDLMMLRGGRGRKGRGARGLLKRGGKGAKGVLGKVGGVAGKLFKGGGIGKIGKVAAGAAGIGGGALAAAKMGGSVLPKAAGAAAKVGGKSVAKTAAKIGGKALGKSLIKKIPVLGAIAGLGFAGHRALGGDWAGAGMELASGLLSIIPGIGTAASVAVDAALAYRDISQEMGEEGEESEKGTLSKGVNLARMGMGGVPMAKGGIVTEPTKILAGEAGPEVIIPLDAFDIKGTITQEVIPPGVENIPPTVSEVEKVKEEKGKSVRVAPSIAPVKKNIDEIPIYEDNIGLMIVNSGRM